MQTTVSIFGVNITFSLSEPHPTLNEGDPHVRAEDQVCLRMSLEHAKVMVLLLKKQLKAYENKAGIQIGIPNDALESLGIKQEDW
jgi:hypothetical protein